LKNPDFLKKMGLEKKRPKEFRDLPPFPKEQLQENTKPCFH